MSKRKDHRRAFLDYFHSEVASAVDEIIADLVRRTEAGETLPPMTVRCLLVQLQGDRAKLRLALDSAAGAA